MSKVILPGWAVDLWSPDIAHWYGPAEERFARRQCAHRHHLDVTASILEPAGETRKCKICLKMEKNTHE
jgi:hypothetical protein